MFLGAEELQWGRGEPVRDMARVLGRLVDGAVVRTGRHGDLVEFAEFGGIPTVNGLTDYGHPCQVMADLLTVRERLGSIEGRVVCFVGDGGCNVATSWVCAAGKFGFELRVASPVGFEPCDGVLAKGGGRVSVVRDPAEGVSGADVVYTDVWVSMGREGEAAERLRVFEGYEVNEGLVGRAREGALVMHCLPAYRGREISEGVLEGHGETIFGQAENRLHAQKGIICGLLGVRR